jgi:hypothetical protein
LFSSDEEALEFIEEYDFIDARVVLLTKLGRRGKAADLYIPEGRKLEAIQLLLDDLGDSHSIHRGMGYILSGLWEIFSMAITPKTKKTRQTVVELLRLARLVKTPMWSPNDRDNICGKFLLSFSVH